MDFVKFMLIALVEGSISEETKEDPKIQGGENVTDIVRFPFIGYWEVSIGGQVRYCTGILIDQFSAITAGHCVLVDERAKPYRLLPLSLYKPFVVFGSPNHSQVSYPFYQRRDIKKLFIHHKAKYDGEYPVEIQYDIGAMKWKKKVDFNEKVQSIPLIPEEMDPLKVFLEIIQRSELCELPGWGALVVHWRYEKQLKMGPETLQVTNFHVIPKYNCCSFYHKKAFQVCMTKFGVKSGLLCFVRQKSTTSIGLGDSGSPLYCPYKGKKYVIGMCATGRHALDPFHGGQIQVFNPSYYVIDSVMRPYIEAIRDTENKFSRSQKTRIGVLWSVLLSVAWKSATDSHTVILLT